MRWSLRLERRVSDQRASLEVFTRPSRTIWRAVRTVQSFAEIVADEEDFTAKGREYVDHIRRSSERMEC